MIWTIRPRFEFPAGIRGIVSGQGTPVVLIHGVGLNADSWGAQINALTSRFKICALDQPGHGQSAPLDLPEGRRLRVSDISERMAPVLRSLREPVCLVGHSLGGLIALDIAVRHPERVRCVAALNTVHRRTAEAQASVQARAAAMDGARSRDPTSTLTRWFGADLSTAPARACRDWLTAVDLTAYKKAYTAFAHGDSPSDAALSAIACPALFLTGARDPNATPAMSETMAALVPGASAVILPDAAHMALMTHPQDVTAALETLFEKVA